MENLQKTKLTVVEALAKNFGAFAFFGVLKSMCPMKKEKCEPKAYCTTDTPILAWQTLVTPPLLAKVAHGIGHIITPPLLQK